MKVLLSWLREFAPIGGDPDEIAAQLTELGMELESVRRPGEGLDGIVLARVLEVRAHPDADRIRLVDVDAGDGEALQICCGASNMVAGDLVPLATIGTTMPGGMEIARRKMRGQESNGMLCSASELELGEDHSGILVLTHGEPGTPVAEVLGLAGEVVYEFDSLPNRPDTLSVLGVARDLAAHQHVELVVPEWAPPVSGVAAATLASVRIDAPDLCGSFLARVLSGVQLGPSPDWLAQRLLASGMRPINNVVDVSNYVMLELGQPNHTYDLATLPGGALGVRWAREGETIRTLDDQERTLDQHDGVIVDADDRAVGIAGVMGGASTEISERTRDVLLELAWWDPAAIAATSARLNLHSEASLRFKRGVDPEIAPLAARRAAQLLAEVAGASLHPGELHATGELPPRVLVQVRTDRVNRLLGTDLARDDVAGLVAPIGYESEVAGDDLVVTVPTWRPDSTLEVDVIEEVARQYGYSRLPTRMPVSPHTGELSARQRDRRTLRRALVGAGLSEAMPMPFLAPGDLERCGLAADGLVLANPLAAEESILRTSLMPGLLAAVRHNASHRQTGVHLFEVGRVFRRGDGPVLTDVAASELAGRVLPGEREHLAVVLAGSDATDAVQLVELLLRSVGRWYDPSTPLTDEASAEATAAALREAERPGLHPGRSADVLAQGVVVGHVGEIDPAVLEAHDIGERVGWLQLDLSTLLDLPAVLAQARPVSRFPSSDIDLAFVVDERVAADELRRRLWTASSEVHVVGVDLFDVFRSAQLGQGRKSLAFRVRFQALDRTLTDAEVASARAELVAAAAADFGAELRG